VGTKWAAQKIKDLSVTLQEYLNQDLICTIQIFLSLQETLLGHYWLIPNSIRVHLNMIAAFTSYHKNNSGEKLSGNKFKLELTVHQ